MACPAVAAAGCRLRQRGSQWSSLAAGGPEEPAVIHEVDWSVNNNNYVSLIGTLGQVPAVDPCH